MLTVVLPVSFRELCQFLGRETIRQAVVQHNMDVVCVSLRHTSVSGRTVTAEYLEKSSVVL